MSVFVPSGSCSGVGSGTVLVWMEWKKEQPCSLLLRRLIRCGHGFLLAGDYIMSIKNAIGRTHTDETSREFARAPSNSFARTIALDDDRARTECFLQVFDRVFQFFRRQRVVDSLRPA